MDAREADVDDAHRQGHAACRLGVGRGTLIKPWTGGLFLCLRFIYLRHGYFAGFGACLLRMPPRRRRGRSTVLGERPFFLFDSITVGQSSSRNSSRRRVLGTAPSRVSARRESGIGPWYPLPAGVLVTLTKTVLMLVVGVAGVMLVMLWLLLLAATPWLGRVFSQLLEGGVPLRRPVAAAEFSAPADDNVEDRSRTSKQFPNCRLGAGASATLRTGA